MPARTLWLLILVLAAINSQNTHAAAAVSRPFSVSPQEQLSRKYGIKAVDQTDEHSPAVLQNFLFLLDQAFSPAFVRSLKNLQYIYAYAGHDQTYDIAAFHPGAMAISIGGKSTYEKIGAVPDIFIITSLAHEMGHAFLLEKLSPSELRELSEKFGGWAPVFKGNSPADFYAKEFFTFHPSFGAGGELAFGEKKNCICSRLAKKNIHEWFAEAFAGTILNELGKKGALGKGWREKLATSPKSKGEYWTNYNLVSGGFSGWLEQKLKLP
ncbi:MAG: hypothetical protein ACXWQO_12440 [Bdellovibrionota bacterium]